MDVYLNDHLSGAAAGMRLVELAAERHHSGELSEFYASLAAEIKADYALLEGLISDRTGAGKAAFDAEHVGFDVDLVGLASGFGHRLHDADMPVTPTQSEQYARSLLITHPTSRRRLYFTTRAIFVTDFEDVPTFDRVFAEVFGAIEFDPAHPEIDAPPAGPLAGPAAAVATQPAASISFEEAQAMNARTQTYRRRGWQAASASTWVTGDADRRGLPRAADDADDPHLKDIFTLETLSTGVESKLSMWKVLHQVAVAYPALAGIDFDALVVRAESQRARVEEMVGTIAPQALARELVGAAA
jgi:hypothetical protein